MASSKSKQAPACSKVVETESSGGLLDENEPAEVTSTGKYQCRYCGLVFETLEAHDRHYREVHGQRYAYLSTQIQS